jgi:hypothetical protein
MSTADDITAAVRIKGLSDAYADEAQNFHAPEADEARTALFEAIDALASERDALLEALRAVVDESGWANLDYRTWEAARAAIKASEGKAA